MTYPGLCCTKCGFEEHSPTGARLICKNRMTCPVCDAQGDFVDADLDLTPNIMQLPDIELVSAKVHEAWMVSKRAQGVTTRKAEDGEELMAPYEVLSEKAKELDRSTVKAVYAAIEASQKDAPSPIGSEYDRARDIAHGR